MGIKNRAELISHGNSKGREAVLDIFESGLKAPDPYENTRKLVRVENGNLIIGHPEFSRPLGPESLVDVSRPSRQEPLVFELSKVNNIYVVGGGKSIQRMAVALENVLGDRITEGHICIKKGDPVEVTRVEVTLAGHPLPDEESVSGAQKIIEVEKKAKEGDIVFLCNSGGGTALMALPAPGITLEELQRVYRILYFEMGATMPEANAVRNLVTVLRGKHTKYVRGATLIHILANELPPKIKGHKFPLRSDEDAYDRAIGVLKKYDCWDKIPASVRDFFNKADPQYAFPTPKDTRQNPNHLFRVMGPEYMLNAAKLKATNMGLSTTIIASSLNDVEAHCLGEAFAQIAVETEVIGNPFEPPCVFMCGGEVVVKVGNAKGSGGRNQEFVLSAAEFIAGSKNIVIASVDSDGTDGPTNIAGGIIDGYTMERIAEAGIDLFQELNNHNSSHVLKTLGDAIYIDYTCANVRDLRVAYISDMILE
jgi:glycerate-2-kinase